MVEVSWPDDSRKLGRLNLVTTKRETADVKFGFRLDRFCCNDNTKPKSALLLCQAKFLAVNKIWLQKIKMREVNLLFAVCGFSD